MQVKVRVSHDFSDKDRWAIAAYFRNARHLGRSTTYDRCVVTEGDLKRICNTYSYEEIVDIIEHGLHLLKTDAAHREECQAEEDLNYPELRNPMSER